MNEYLNHRCEVDEWIREVQEYVRIADEQMMCAKCMVFGIEAKVFRTYSTPARQITVMVCIFLTVTINF